MATVVRTQSETGTAAEPVSIPPFENGDRLTREEFYDRWQVMPRLKRAERIEGVVYMQAAVRYRQHGGPHAKLVAWLVAYEAATPGVESGDNATVQLDLDNDPQPDAFLRIAPECGGQSKTTDDGYIDGAPELVAEVAASSASYDLHDKLNVYRRAGVREYLVWKVLEKEIVWYHLQNDEYVPLPADDSGISKSSVFPGLWLDMQSMIAGDIARVLAVLQQGAAIEEHNAFVEKLKQAGTGD